MNKWRPAAAHIPPAAGLNLRAKPRLAVIQQRSAEQQELFLNGAILGVSGQILSVIVENTCLLPQNYTLSEDGKNVRLMSPLSVGERWSVKYLQDIQTLSTLVGAIVYEDMEVA